MQLRIVELYLVLLVSVLELLGDWFYKERDSVPEFSTDQRQGSHNVAQHTVFKMVVGLLVGFIGLNVVSAGGGQIDIPIRISFSLR